MDYDKLLTLGTDLGRLLMESGAEIFRVEESVIRLLSAYGVRPQVFAIPNCLIVSITTPEGHPITRMDRIPAHGTDIELLERCNALCRQLCRELPPLEEAQRRVDALPEHPVNSQWLVLLGYGAAAAFFALFFGGSWRDGLCAALCGLAVGLCLLFGQWLTGSNMFLRTAVCAAVAAGLALVLVPGMALTNAMREIMAGDIISGVNRTAEALLAATAIALGAAIPLVFQHLL